MQENKNIYVQLELPHSYAYHINQPITVTNIEILVLKRAFSIKEPYKVEKYKTSECVKLTYESGVSPFKAIIGSALIVLILGIFYYLHIYWEELQPGTEIRYGALGLAAIYGFRWVFGLRRHKLVFTMKNNKKLKWVSGSGDYKYKISAVNRILESFKSMNIEVSGEKIT